MVSGMQFRSRALMAVPVLALVAVTVVATGGNLDTTCPSTVPGLTTGVVTVADDVVTLVTPFDGTRSWELTNAAQAFSDGGQGVIASDGSSLRHLSDKDSELYEGSHLLLGAGDDSSGKWWAFAAVDPSMFGESDDGSTMLAAFPIGGGEAVAIGDASGPEYGVVHLAASAGTVTITSIDDLGEMVRYASFDGGLLTFLDGFENEPVEYNRAPFLAATVQMPLSAVAYLEAPEETEQSTTTAWFVRIADQRTGETFASYQIGPDDASVGFTGLVATTDGALAISDGSAWLVDRTGATEVVARCVTGRITDVVRMPMRVPASS